MGRDRGYGSGYKNTGKSDPTVGTNGKRKASGAETARIKANDKKSFDARMKARGPDPTMMMGGISAGLKALYTLGRLAPKYMGKSIVEAAAAGNRVRAYNEGVRARETYARAAKIAKMTGPKAPQAAKEVLEWADARKLAAQALRDRSR